MRRLVKIQKKYYYKNSTIKKRINGMITIINKRVLIRTFMLPIISL